MMPRRSHLLLALVLAIACAPRTQSTSQREPEPARARAALATLRVDNRTRERLTILYRLTGRTDAEVSVGQITALSTAEMAPVPAAEPLILVARTATGTELELAARTFPLDGDWTWVIPADTRFIRPGRAQ